MTPDPITPAQAAEAERLLSPDGCVSCDDQSELRALELFPAALAWRERAIPLLEELRRLNLAVERDSGTSMLTGSEADAIDTLLGDPSP